MIKRLISAAMLCMVAFAFAACGNTETDERDTEPETVIVQEPEEAKTGTADERVLEDIDEGKTEKRMIMKIGEIEVPVTWEQNASVEKLRELLPITIQMSMYGGFEQVGAIGQSITRDDVQMTTESGDIVLYSGSQIVVFYGSNSWSYTKLGHVDLLQEEMNDLLGNGDTTITISEE